MSRIISCDSTWNIKSRPPRKPAQPADPLPTRPCPKCQASSEFEEFTSTKTDPPTRRRLIRCPNAKGKTPTCTVTIEDVEEADVPKITRELKERITILKNNGITQKQIADRAGHKGSTMSAFVSGAASLKHGPIEDAIMHFELNEVGPPLPRKVQTDLTHLVQAANAVNHSKDEDPLVAEFEKRTAKYKEPGALDEWGYGSSPAGMQRPLSIDQLVDQLVSYPAELRAEILQLVEEQAAVNDRRAILARLAEQEVA